MANNSETGHAVNVANFKELISYVKGYRESYNPSNQLIAVPSLENILSIATLNLEQVSNVIANYNAAVSGRELLFAPLSKLVTRAMNFLKSTGVPDQVYDQVNTVARKVKGTRASAIDKPEPPAEEEGPKPGKRHVSASQMGYDSRAENFSRFIQLLAGIPQYNPNESDLKTESITTYDGELKTSNSAVTDTEVVLSSARLDRNRILYADVSGLCDVAMAVKNYVIAIFGATSPQYKQISKIAFKKNK
jgi:hypothetical protein